MIYVSAEVMPVSLFAALHSRAPGQSSTSGTECHDTVFVGSRESTCNLFLVLQNSRRYVAETVFFYIYWLTYYSVIISRTALTYKMSKLKRKCQRKTKTKMILKTKKNTVLGPTAVYKIPRGIPSAGALNVRGGKIWKILPFISKTVLDRPVVTMKH